MKGADENPDRDSSQPPAAHPAEHAQAGEYGEGAAHEATGVGPRNPRTADQRLDDRRMCGPTGTATAAATPGDAQLRELIRQRLTEDPTLDASDISIEVHSGRVSLAGTVPSARVRAEIEQTIENCGACEIDNQLRALS